MKLLGQRFEVAPSSLGVPHALQPYLHGLERCLNNLVDEVGLFEVSVGQFLASSVLLSHLQGLAVDGPLHVGEFFQAVYCTLPPTTTTCTTSRLRYIIRYLHLSVHLLPSLLKQFFLFPFRVLLSLQLLCFELVF